MIGGTEADFGVFGNGLFEDCFYILSNAVGRYMMDIFYPISNPMPSLS